MNENARQRIATLRPPRSYIRHAKNAFTGILVAFLAVSALASDPIRPDPRITPGVTAINVRDVCAVKWGKDARHVTLAMKKQCFASYGIPWTRHAEFEVDHLISRELGGADDIRNLWPQPWKGDWNAHMKDRLENRLHALVCLGKITLPDAQKQIATDWIQSFRANVVIKAKRK